MSDQPVQPPRPAWDLAVKVDGEARALRWQPAGEHLVQMEVEGEPRRFEAQRIAAGRWLLREGTRQVVVDLDGRLPKAVATVAHRDGESRAVSVELLPPASKQGGARQATESTGPITLRAMMPGRVVKVLVEVGQTVRAGQPLLVVEAMKMENDVLCPRDARILALHCAEGAAVEPHQDLVSLG